MLCSSVGQAAVEDSIQNIRQAKTALQAKQSTSGFDNQNLPFPKLKKAYENALGEVDRSQYHQLITAVNELIWFVQRGPKDARLARAYMNFGLWLLNPLGETKRPEEKRDVYYKDAVEDLDWIIEMQNYSLELAIRHLDECYREIIWPGLLEFDWKAFVEFVSRKKLTTGFKRNLQLIAEILTVLGDAYYFKGNANLWLHCHQYAAALFRFIGKAAIARGRVIGPDQARCQAALMEISIKSVQLPPPS